MAGPFAPRKRFIPDLVSVLIIYLLTALGAFLYAQSVLAGAPDFPGVFERLPIALLAILPTALLVVLVARGRRLALDLRAKRYGSRLRLRLTGLFALGIAAAALPQGLFLLRIANLAQASSSSADVRDALARGQALALGWYDEELGRVERAGMELARRYGASRGESGKRLPDAAVLLAELKARDPRLEALELFARGRSSDFAGPFDARLQSPPPPPTEGSSGHQLAASSSGDTSLLRYAIPLAAASGARGSFAVLSLRLPDGLDRAAAALSAAARTESFLLPFSAKWAHLLGLLYGFLVLPLLLAALLLGMTAADLVAEPLASLEEATRRVAKGEFGVRLIVKPGDETGRLVASFNRMLDEIERSRSDELRRGKIDAWQDIAQRLAHELKNPLTPIRLTAERVLKRWQADPAQAASIIDGSMLAIVKEVEGMDALLGDFRAFASLPEPQRDWTELASLVADSVALYATSYPDVRFTLSGLQEGLTLRVDRASMKRALGNIIANSIDAMEGAGEIEISADLVKAADSRYCRLRIRDTGCGISASLGEKIFMPYFTTKSSGTGLGLSIVERIVAEHGGAIRFESDEGAGTTFFVDLPLDR
jgi:two-component system, NtrC family, nitrogen regulation sensor histidine kinase NtrY